MKLFPFSLTLCEVPARPGFAYNRPFLVRYFSVIDPDGYTYYISERETLDPQRVATMQGIKKGGQ